MHTGLEEEVKICGGRSPGPSRSGLPTQVKASTIQDLGRAETRKDALPSNPILVGGLSPFPPLVTVGEQH